MSHFLIWFYWYGVRCPDTCQNNLTSSLVQHYMYISQQDFNNININGQMVKWSISKSFGQKKTRLLALTRALGVTLYVCPSEGFGLTALAHFEHTKSVRQSDLVMLLEHKILPLTYKRQAGHYSMAGTKFVL